LKEQLSAGDTLAVLEGVAASWRSTRGSKA
jgi:hypothetical protein